MEFTLDREIEELVAREVREGRFESPQALLNTAVRHLLAARRHGESEANKLALLREQLRRADEQIDAGDYSDYTAETLPSLFSEIRKAAAQRLDKGPVNS